MRARYFPSDIAPCSPLSQHGGRAPSSCRLTVGRYPHTQQAVHKAPVASTCLCGWTLRLFHMSLRSALPVHLGGHTRRNALPLVETLLAVQRHQTPEDRKYHPQRFVGKTCVCDPAQADSVTERGSTWPKMAFVSHPRLVTTAQPSAGGPPLCTRNCGPLHGNLHLCHQPFGGPGDDSKRFAHCIGGGIPGLAD